MRRRATYRPPGAGRARGRVERGETGAAEREGWTGPTVLVDDCCVVGVLLLKAAGAAARAARAGGAPAAADAGTTG